MEQVVLKFGGTSLSTAQNRQSVYRIVHRFLSAAKQVVMVVSAFGRSPAPYATDTLLSYTNEFTPLSEKDLLLSVGETISSIAIANELRQYGYAVKALNVYETGICTDEEYGAAKVLWINDSELRKALQNHQIVVVPGFQGYTSKYRVTTLGRGGSDLTAIWMAATLQLDMAYIYTDVDGVYDKDPKNNPEAVLYSSLSYEQMLILCHQGSRIMHDKSVLLAQSKQIAITVRNTFSDAIGTMIGNFL